MMYMVGRGQSGGGGRVCSSDDCKQGNMRRFL